MTYDELARCLAAAGWRLMRQDAHVDVWRKGDAWSVLHRDMTADALRILTTLLQGDDQ